MPKAEAIMDYMLDTMKGSGGVVKCPGKNNGLANLGDPSSYMDGYRSGYIDAWINAGFYTVLQDMAELEDVVGHAARRDEYRALAKSFPANFDKSLWNTATDRYMGWERY